jgi:hypothetical protein
MKINIVTLLIALAVAALVAYGFYTANSGEGYALALTFGAGLTLFITLAGTIAVGTKDGQGSMANIRIVSGIFFLVTLIEQLVFSFVPLSLPPYIIVTGVLMLIYLLIVSGIGKAIREV